MSFPPPAAHFHPPTHRLLCNRLPGDAPFTKRPQRSPTPAGSFSPLSAAGKRNLVGIVARKAATSERMECEACDLCRGSGTVLLSRCGRAARRRALVRWSVQAKPERTELHCRAEAKHGTVDLRHLSMLGIPFSRENLHRQMLPHHFGAQLITLARRHHRAFGHHHIFFSQPCRKVKALFDEQNGKPS